MDYRISVDISAPPDLVWSIITDVERWHEWTASVRGIRLLDKDKGPLRIGSRALVRQPKLLPAVWKVTALDPGRGFTWTTGAPATWIHAFHAVDPIPTGARVTLRVEFSARSPASSPGSPPISTTAISRWKPLDSSSAAKTGTAAASPASRRAATSPREIHRAHPAAVRPDSRTSSA